jgi:endonuclease/exonuclease/phosphatase (EEP) superfamily protein YafD
LNRRDPAGGSRVQSPARRLLWLARSSLALLAAAFVAAQFGELHFALDNLSNFPVHFGVAFLACAVVLAKLGDRRLALVSATLLALALVPVVQWYLPGATKQPAPGATPVKLLISNVYFRNRQHARLLRLIDRERPDVVGLVEVNARWLRKVARLRAEYPYHFEIPDEAIIGLALYSKLPLTNARVLRAGESGTPAIAATLATADGEIEIILAHPMSPLNAEHVRRRNAQLRALGDYVGSLDRPVVIAGDLNATMWNRIYREFAESGGLHNARAGYGVGPTWPSVWPLGVPIDHILATELVRFRSFRVLESVGSDHLPVSAEFSVSQFPRLAITLGRMHAAMRPFKCVGT